MATITPAGLRLIQNYEGVRLKAYRDAVQVLTIGYGHTGPDVTDGLEITQARADELLRQDVARFERGVEDALTRAATAGQFDAMVSLAFNIGLGAFRSSTLLRLFNEGKPREAAQQFGEWVMAGPQVLRGLVRRRVAEVIRFLD